MKRLTHVLVRMISSGASVLLAALVIGCAATLASVPAPTAVPALSASPSAASAKSGLPVLPAGGGPGGMSSITAMPNYKDVAYASGSAAQKLDLYVPQGKGPFPVIVVIHPGGFMMGDKTGVDGVDLLLSQGYAVASINYRLSAEAKFPAQIYDAKAAVRFLRANATKYNLNPQKFGAWGASAGGNLASLLGTSCGVAALEGTYLGNADQSSCVQVVVDWFGPIDFLQMDAQFAGTSCPANHNEANSPESQLLGAAIQTKPELAQAANPITYINAKAVPFLIQNGSADCNIPPVQGQLLADALSAAIGKDKVMYTLLPDGGHGGPQFTTAENLKLISDFLNKYLK